MKFASKTEEQLIKESLLEAGIYNFEVLKAEDAMSKKGNEMIKMDLKVFRPDGGFIYVTDYLLESMGFKLIHFCRTAELTKSYEAGTLTAQECVGRCGRVAIKVEEQEGYKPKNSVKDYVSEEKKGEVGAPVKAAPRASAAAVDESEPPF